MPIITVIDEPNIWKAVCKEVQEKKRQYELSTNLSLTKQKEQLIQFDPSKHSTIFYNHAYLKSDIDDPTLTKDFNPSIIHPACYGYTIHKYEKSEEVKEEPCKLPNIKSCSERDYMQFYVFPTLLPALENMLKEAQKHKCFERKRTPFNACDFLTQYLYSNNPFKTKIELAQRKITSFWDIPFVKSWNEKNPRPPLPLSLVWTEEEAARRIQAFFRGYLVRRDPEVQELRQWQREWREENQRIEERVEKFWKNN